MKAAIHPQFFETAQVICVCGNRFTVGSTQEIIHIELCSKCHPFYTGTEKIVDTRGRVEKYQKRVAAAKKPATGSKK